MHLKAHGARFPLSVMYYISMADYMKILILYKLLPLCLPTIVAAFSRQARNALCWLSVMSLGESNAKNVFILQTRLRLILKLR